MKKLRDNLPRRNGDPLKLAKKFMKNKKCKFELKTVGPDVIRTIILKMKNSSSCGLDNINSYILKLAVDELVPVITHLVNLSIMHRKFPTRWKISKIIPLHKKDETILPKNYRPVSLLCITSKILEKAVFLQMFEYFEENSLIHPSHHAYRPLHSTTTALIEMIDNWAEAYENEEISAVVMYDQSAAFDVCDHEILKNKLNIYGLQEGALLWISSYLENRKQCVYIEGAFSSILELGEAGVPQGGNLSPLLYNIYCSDLPEAIHDHEECDNTNEHIDDEAHDESEEEHKSILSCKKCGKIVCYADDCTYSASDKDPKILKEKIETSFIKIKNYMDNNKLFLNSDKTHLMIMSSSRSHSLHQDFNINLNTGSEIIEPSKEERLLGATVTNDFLWKTHLRDHKKSLLSTLKSKNNALSIICHYSSFKVRKMFANGLIMSHILYHIQLYGGTTAELLSAIQVQQNRAARLVCKLPWRTNTKILLDQLGWMNVKQMVAFYSLMSLYKTKQTKLPKYIHEVISTPFKINTRIARTGGIRDTRLFKKEIGNSTFISRTTDLWNTMPTYLRMENEINTFSSKLRVWVKQSIS